VKADHRCLGRRRGGFEVRHAVLGGDRTREPNQLAHRRPWRCPAVDVLGRSRVGCLDQQGERRARRRRPVRRYAGSEAWARQTPPPPSANGIGAVKAGRKSPFETTFLTTARGSDQYHRPIEAAPAIWCDGLIWLAKEPRPRADGFAVRRRVGASNAPRCGPAASGLTAWSRCPV